VTESSDGNTWTSRMLQNEECPIRLATVWETCGVFELTAAIGDGYPLAAKYWAAYGNGIAAFQHTNVLDPWELAKIEPCIDADNNPCDGNW
jgi:hypothetical protein